MGGGAREQARVAAAAGLLGLLAVFPIDSIAQQGKPKVPPQLPPQAAEQAQQQVAANTAPSVSLTTPANDELYTAPATVVLEASAAASSGGRSITQVEFFSGGDLIGTATTAPYAFSWTPVAAGTYSLTARATDNLGVAATSLPVSIIVNAPPSVDLTAPANNAVFTSPATIELTAAAADSDGTIVQLEFFQGTTLLATVTGEPYSFSLANVPAGNLTFTARATDNRGVVTTSTEVAVLVNAPPSVSLTSPTGDADFRAPASITITADAADSDGTIDSVQFYNGTSVIATVTASPYTINWTGVPAGTYTLTARVTDNLGAVTISDPTNVTVAQALAQIYYIHTDHLNTPRAIYDQQQRLVWRWDQADPFGGNPPNENPSGLGNFTCNLRLPGQYFDRETNTHYNYFRDYDPQSGRYVQSDPIGLQGGINNYQYVRANPLSSFDPDGLRALFCCRLLNSRVIGTAFRQRHCYFNVDGTTYGLYPVGNVGVPRINDPQDRGGICKECKQMPCSDVKTCINDQHEFYPIGTYNAVAGPNSNTYAGTIARACCDGGVPRNVGSAPSIGDKPPVHNPSGQRGVSR